MASNEHHIIYIPGLGDNRTYGQDLAINLWRLFGFRPHYFPLGWGHKEGFETKLRRLLGFIDELAATGSRVSLVGVSAGASAAINAYVASDNVTWVVYICGKINNPQTIHLIRYKMNPDFEESLLRLQGSLQMLSPQDKTKLLSIHPLKDASVPIQDTVIPGVKAKTTLGWSHAQGIFAGVVFGSATLSRFLHSIEGGSPS